MVEEDTTGPEQSHEQPHHHRESAATYRRRRIVVGLGALVVVALAVAVVARLGSDAEEVILGDPGVAAGTAPDGGDGTDDTGDDASSGGGSPGAGTDPTASSTTTSTTALVIPGFATPQDYLACVKDVESRGDYAAVSPDGRFFGAYQIDQVTWNNTAVHAGLYQLYQVQPNLALPSDQDTLAMALLAWQGTSPWAGDC